MQLSKHSSSLLLTLIGLVSIAIVYLTSGWSRVFSVMHQSSIVFTIVYMMIMILCLFFFVGHLSRVQLWRAVVIGMVVGYFAGLISYFVAVLFMPLAEPA